MARYLDNRSIDGQSTALYRDESQRALAQGWVANPPARLATQSTAARLGALAPEIAAPFVFRLAMAPVMTVIWLAAALLETVQDLTLGLRDSWRALASSAPWLAKLLQLTAGAVAMAGGLWQAGFPAEAWIVGAALVPILWSWQRLTLLMPLLLMPISALAAAEALYISLSKTRGYWEPAWSSLTDGLPLAGHLPLLVLLPAAILGWRLAVARWPAWLRGPELLAAGTLLAFVLTRVWTGWQPGWERAIAPVPFDTPIGPLLVLLPLSGWLWSLGNRRWPDVFATGHLLALGGLLALAAAHSEAVWAGFWADWAGDLPLAAFPFIVICLAPLVGGVADEATRAWPKVMIVPDLLLLSAVSWLILDRTRAHWIDGWETAWGEVPARPDLALAALALPLLAYGWLLGANLWPRAWVWPNAALLGISIAWATDRTRAFWLDDWHSFAGETANPALLVAMLPLVIVGWQQGRHHWRGGANFAVLTWLSVLTAWLASRVIDGVRLLPTLAALLLPLAVIGWWKVVRRHPRAGWGFTLLPVLAIAAVASIAPHLLADLTAPLLALLLA